MRLAFDRAADAVYVTVRAGTVSRTVPLDDSRLVDYDRSGRVLGYEFLGVSEGIAVEGIPGDVLLHIEKRIPRARFVVAVEGVAGRPHRRGAAPPSPNGAKRHVNIKELTRQVR